MFALGRLSVQTKSTMTLQLSNTNINILNSRVIRLERGPVVQASRKKY